MVGHGLAWAVLLGFLEPEAVPPEGDVRAVPADALGVFVRCPDLGDEASASVEARARADLLAQGIDRGLLVIACADGTAQAAWMTVGQEPRAQRVPLAASERERVEQLVALAAESVTRETSEVAPTPSAAVPPVPVLAPPPPAPVRAPVGGRAAVEPEAIRDKARRTALVLGPRFELWGTEALGAFGVRGGLALPIGRRYALVPTVAYESALSSPSGVTARQFLTTLEFSAELTSFLLLDAGIAGSLMTFGGPPNVTPEDRTSIVPALVAGAGFPVRFGGGNQAVFGLGVRAYSVDRTVTVDDRRVLRVPVATLTLGVDLRVGL